MSVYKKEKPEYLMECFESLLAQTVQPSEWVIVLDGPLTPELNEVIKNYSQKYPNLIKTIPLEQNVGLGLALREGVTHCSYDYVARMDTDDVCVVDRFEKQVNFMKENIEIDICGGQIAEFEGEVKNIVSIREVPLTDNEIKKYQKTRSPFNHMSVFFKKDAVLSSGNYEDAPLMEDDMLWGRMALAGKQMANLSDILVYVRVGNDMIKRRGGIKYYKKYKASRKKMYELGMISHNDYTKTLFVQFIVALMPNNVRKFVFYKLLRKKPKRRRNERKV